MSKRIERLMEKFPQVFYDVSYEGNGVDQWGRNTGDGTWLYMRPGWYCASSDCGTIHEYTIAEVLRCAKAAYQDKDRWIASHPTDIEEIEKILNGDYDK